LIQTCCATCLRQYAHCTGIGYWTAAQMKWTGSKLARVKPRVGYISYGQSSVQDIRLVVRYHSNHSIWRAMLAGVSSSNWSKLVLLDGSHNFLTGSIPTGIYHLPVLAYLGLSHNRCDPCCRCCCYTVPCCTVPYCASRTAVAVHFTEGVHGCRQVACGSSTAYIYCWLLKPLRAWCAEPSAACESCRRSAC
jgi:hypothetical protein